ncbi:carotenoid oxygenase [Tirmania nivea]|nr:carotenoid oxygenase [Tirmania nivea]
MAMGTSTTVMAECLENTRAFTTNVGRTVSKRKRKSLFGSSKLQAASGKTKGQSQDWPNAIGFKFHKDVTAPVQLHIIGEFPDYVRGTLYRIGPGGHEVETDSKGTFSIDHWFDSLSQIHRFHIVDSKAITYNSRHTCDSLVEQYRRQGGIGNLYSFGQGRDPCRSVFSKFMSVFKASVIPISENSPSSMNIGVTVSTDYPGLPSTTPSENTKNLYAKTDKAAFQELHPETLEPIGLADQAFLHPALKGPLSAAHARTDPETGDVFNYNLELGSQTTYRVFKVHKVSGKAVILATIQDAPAAYIHSFFLSKKYVILCVWNSHFAYRGAAILWKKNIMDAMSPYDGNKKAKFYVIDRTDNMDGVVGVYESDAFFAFHTVNAWEEERVDGRGEDIICEVTSLNSLDILKKFYFHNLLGNPKEAEDWLRRKEPRMARFRLESVGTKTPQEPVKKRAGYSCGFKIEEALREYTTTEEQNFELATINPDYLCKPHRFTYGLNTLGASTLLENIIKYDSHSHTSIMWSEQGHTPGEPIFIANPNSITGAEDDGVLLSVVLDGHKGKSYLLCLDARDLKEVARAEMDSVVPLGFHGKYVGGKKVVVEAKGANERGWAEW